MANPRHNTQTTNRRGAMGGGMMKKRPGYKAGKSVKNGLGMQSVIHGLDNKPQVTAADPKAKFIAKNKTKGNA